MDKQAGYLQLIRETYPDLRFSRALHREGQFNDVLVLDDEIVFRFPKYPHAVEALAVEKALLSRLQPYVGLSIPLPIYASVDSGTVGHVFVGYRVIPGEPLQPQVLSALDEQTRQDLARQLATFLRQLHNVPIAELGLFLPVRDRADEWSDLYEEFRSRLFPHMRPDARRRVADRFQAFLSDPRRSGWKPSLRHGDFGPSNVLYDARTRTISGIIDFSSAGLGDPAVDIGGVLCWGEAFLEQFLDIYPDIELMLDRARFYQGTYALQEALDGLRDGDPEAFRRGIADYV